MICMRMIWPSRGAVNVMSVLHVMVMEYGVMHVEKSGKASIIKRMAVGRKDREGSISAAEVSQGMIRSSRGGEAAGASVLGSDPGAKPADSQGAARAAPVQGIQQRAV